MLVKVKIVIMSHLSDIQANPINDANNTKINFVKYLVLNYTNMNEVIDVDAVYEYFLKKM